MLMRRLAAGPLAVLLGFALLAPAQDGPSQADISKWVEDLGHARFVKRQDAIKKLWEAGSKAEPALREAAKSRDAEVAKAAKELLERIDWGILHDSPPAILKEIANFKEAAGSLEKDNTRFERRRASLQSLLAMRPVPLVTIRKLLEKPAEEYEKIDNYSQVSNMLQARVADWWQDGRRADIDSLCDFILAGPEVNFARPYAAYMQLTGRLKEALARWEGDKLEPPLHKTRDLVLTHLYREAGQKDKALAAAKRVGDHPFLTQTQLALMSWKDLNAWPGQRTEGEHFLGTYATIARLASDGSSEVKQLANFRKIAEDGETTPGALRDVCLSLMMAGQAKEGLEPLLRRKRSMLICFDCLVAQSKYKEALDLAADATRRDTPDEEKDDLFTLKLRRARLLQLLGEREAATQIARAVAQKEPVSNNNLLQFGPIRRMTEAGFRDVALEWACDSLKAGTADAALLDHILFELFPGHRIKMYLAHAYQQSTDEKDPAKALRACVRFMDGKAEPAERAKVTGWIELHLRDHSFPDDTMYQALPGVLADLLTAEGKLGEAIALLEKAVKVKDDATLRRDLIELRMKSQPADETRRKALFADAEALRKLEGDDGLPLMAAFADADKKAECEFLARLEALSETGRRLAIVQGLAKIGLTDRAAEQAELAVAHGWPAVGAFEYAEALERAAVHRVRQRKFGGAADLTELSTLIYAMSDAPFAGGAAYWLLPQNARLRRGYELLYSGKVDEAVPILRRHLELVPGDISAVIIAWPELVKQGKKAEAEAFYKTVHDTFTAALKQYPKYANGWNSLAWMEINCRTDAKAALEHARKATELEPDNASYRDTLAECYFVTGDKAKAIETIQRNIKQDPLRTYFRRQLERFQTKDPATSWPDEEEE